MASKATEYTAAELEMYDYIPARELREQVAEVMHVTHCRGDLDRYTRHMERLRGQLAALDLVREACDVTYKGGRKPLYYRQDVVLIMVAYMRWRPYGTRKSVVEIAELLRALLAGKEWAMNYIPKKYRNVDLVDTSEGSPESPLEVYDLSAKRAAKMVG